MLRQPIGLLSMTETRDMRNISYHQGVIAMAIEDKTLLTEDEIRAEVADLEGWKYLEDSKELQRVWHFEKFVPTMAFVRRLTEIMDENNHHSDISLNSRTKTLTVTVTTHSKNAVTRADLDFAGSVNQG